MRHYTDSHRMLGRARLWLLFFIVCLFFSGLTAIPLETELALLTNWIGSADPGGWFNRVADALIYINRQHPFLAYGYDWLAFAHFLFAILFAGILREPGRNLWVIDFGIIACLLIPPFAFVAGWFRGIPFAWQLIDSSFGVFAVPLMRARTLIRRAGLLANVRFIHQPAA